MTFKSSTKRGCIYGEPSSSTETNLQDGNDGNKFNSNGQHLKSHHIPTNNVDDNGLTNGLRLSSIGKVLYTLLPINL